MDLLNDLKERQLFNGSHEHICLVRYVFLSVLQMDLDECKEIWNTHTIRAVKQSRCPSGKPDAIYALPHRSVYDYNKYFTYLHFFNIIFKMIFNTTTNSPMFLQSRVAYFHITKNVI